MPDRIRSPKCLQKSIRYAVVQAGDVNVFLAKPSTEICDHDKLASNRIRRVALLGYKARIRIQVFA